MFLKAFREILETANKRFRFFPICYKALALLLIAGPVVADDQLDRRMGKELFERNWVQAPSTTRASDGLGPLFNARACAACHPKGGAVPIELKGRGYASVGLLARLGDGKGHGDPVYGAQLQSAAISGLRAEGNAQLGPDGPSVALIVGALDPATKIGLRRAPTLAGRGLIDVIPNEAIRAHADPNDRDRDGISGRVHETAQGIGRFGWKAEHATLEDQVASAFSMDMGLSSAGFPAYFGDCTSAQVACRNSYDGSDELGDGFELSDRMIELVTAYVASLGRERPGTREGADLFEQAGCSACHLPALKGPDGDDVAIYTDLLLHDMGAGLADGFATPGVAVTEWRTAPLIGRVTSGSRLLHDGRAGTVAEAIGWHNGEAAMSRDAFNALSEVERKALINFVAGL